MPLRRPRRGSVALVLAGMLALGCVAAPRDGADRPAAAPQAPAAPGASDGTGTVEEFRRDIDGATTVAEGFWKAQFAESGVEFRPVAEVIAYQRADEVTCGGQPLGLNNAAYCSAGDFIAYDVRWALGAFRQIGDAFIFYLLGHEYAHAVQVRLGIRKRFTIQQELQADCMAGALLGGSVRARALELDEGDLDEFRDGLLAVGDDPGQPWFADGSHGTAKQRTDAFAEGFEKSLSACDLP